MSDVKSTTDVEYRDIPGFPGYRAGSDGSIWSCWGSGHHGKMGGVWKQMTALANPKIGHLHVTLTCPPIRAKRYVHRLIATAFLGPIPSGYEVCHNDGNPANNTPTNLRFDTRKGNLADRVAHGTLNCGERQGHAKLTTAIVRAMRAEYAAGGVSYNTLGARYGVDHSTVYAIIKRKTWTHI